ncbi:hypothetical protein NDA11_004782 [Ustilago hordei]|uniref:Uncharacterized protein n=1 Tax=Ustilago hordei TaxID=120017 RepID=I2FN65_USTHO|nr:hypothetical protein NDA10_004033 [Ustilago hordei]KAJ1574058.1 hypothetical protein NDA12_003236 [Ustilago hordei]KAJ1574534.1 hypothetical protein NDA15_004929 [Ustilago hordei]KAJ1580353.1 hypothetical protein NDA11_004782 [Ustilago hordei]KAJ1599665.1 hypothetical protein NDA14_007881 [Ustilago hordei]
MRLKTKADDSTGGNLEMIVGGTCYFTISTLHLPACMRSRLHPFGGFPSRIRGKDGCGQAMLPKVTNGARANSDAEVAEAGREETAQDHVRPLEPANGPVAARRAPQNQTAVAFHQCRSSAIMKRAAKHLVVSAFLTYQLRLAGKRYMCTSDFCIL